MRYLKKFESLDGDKLDGDQLKDLLQKLDHSLGRLKSFAQYQNRKSTMVKPDERGIISGRDIQKLNDEYEEFFLSMIDDGWKYYRDSVDFYSEIRLKKPVKKEDAELEFNKIVQEMTEIKSRFDARGFTTHFMFSFNGKSQQDLNPITHKTDLYKFHGIGEKDCLKWSDQYKDKFPSSEYFLAEIKFIYI